MHVRVRVRVRLADGVNKGVQRANEDEGAWNSRVSLLVSARMRLSLFSKRENHMTRLDYGSSAETTRPSVKIQGRGIG